MSARRFLWKALLGLVVAGWLVPALVGGAADAQSPGTMDTNFGYVTVLSSPGRIYAMAVDEYDRVVAAGELDGHWVITRVLANGTIDTSFGSAGQVLLFGQTAGDRAYDVAIQSDGKIVVVGWTGFAVDEQFTVVRLNENGGLDSTFGNGGIVKTPINKTGAIATAVAIQQDGKIVVGGVSKNSLAKQDITLARYNQNGSLDTAGFGPLVKKNKPDRYGYVIDDIDADTGDGVYRGVIALQPDGKILVGGWAGQLGSHPEQLRGWMIARYQPDGSVDDSFGTQGKVIADSYGPFTYLHLKGLAVQNDGKIVASGRGPAGLPGDIRCHRPPVRCKRESRLWLWLWRPCLCRIPHGGARHAGCPAGGREDRGRPERCGPDGVSIPHEWDARRDVWGWLRHRRPERARGIPGQVARGRCDRHELDRSFCGWRLL